MQEKDPGAVKRIILAVVISVGIMLIYNLVLKTEEKPSQQTEINQTEKKESLLSESSQKEPIEKKEVKPESKPDVNALEKTAQQEILLSKETDEYKLTFSTKGGTLNKIEMKKIFNKDGAPIEITPQLSQTMNPLFYRIGNSKEIDYKIESETSKSIVFVQENPEWIITKKYSFEPQRYDILLSITVQNKTDKEIATTASLFFGTSLGPIIEKEENRTRYDEEVLTAYYSRMEKGETEISGETVTKNNIPLNWVGMDNRYFLAAIIPNQEKSYDVYIKNESELFDESMVVSENIVLKPKSSYDSSFTVYLGPKNETELEKYGKKLESVTERGFALTRLIGKGIKWLLFKLNLLFSNFGVSIIFIALIFKVLLHPLTKKSMESAKKMQNLKPQLDALKKKYTDSKELNAKTWELYRREKINPASGCLPMILQMPFFFALYQVIPYTVELQNVHFLWINDLSSPDTVAFIEAFKTIFFLPYKLNILPLLLTVLSFVQTKVTQTSAAGQNKMMEYLMPLMFLFIFWNMPSGLVLYWLMQTVFTIIHQMIVNKLPSRNQGKKKEKAIKMKR